MATKIRLKLKKNERKCDVIKTLCHEYTRLLREREMGGKVGNAIENIISRDDFIRLQINVIDRNGWISSVDRGNTEKFENYMISLFSTIMRHLKNKDDTVFYYPQLLYSPNVGYFIARNHEEIEENYRIRSASIGAMQKMLEQRTIDAHSYLIGHGVEFLPDTKHASISNKLDGELF